MNRNQESWAFAALMGRLKFVTLSLTVMSGAWAIVGNVGAVVLGVLPAGLYWACVQRNA